jgi:hypothetical protein
MKNPLPPKPQGFPGSPLFSGTIRRLLKNRLVSYCPKNTQFFWNVLQGVKRGCAKVDDDFVKAGLADHSSVLSKPPTHDYVDNRDKYAIIFESMTCAAPEICCDPTKSACYESTRGMGGGYAHIQGQQIGRDKDDLDVEFGLIKMVEISPNSDHSQLENRTGILEVHGCVNTFNWFDVKKHLAPKGYPRTVHASAIPEPLKVRTVTKGPAGRAWQSAFAQRALWKHLGNFGCFDLTKGPMVEEQVKRVHNNAKVHDKRNVGSNECLGSTTEVKPRELWCSGDYSAATDGIDIRQTKDALKAFCDHQQLICPTWTPEVTEVLESELLEQQIEYSAHPSVKQANGQLMGSKLSFPFLCLINMVGYWNSLESYYQRDVDITELDDFLVNGDDILFKTNDDHYEHWKNSVASLGLKLSVGKNYIHRKLFTVNSELYEETDYGFRRYFYLNLGSLFAQESCERIEITSGPLWDRYNWMMLGSLNRDRLHRRFIHYHLDDIKKITSDGLINLFLPQERGGCGFDQFVPFDVTYLQRKYASALWLSTCGHPEDLQKRKIVTEDAPITYQKRSKQYQYWVHDTNIQGRYLEAADRKINFRHHFAAISDSDKPSMSYQGWNRKVSRRMDKVQPMSLERVKDFPYRITVSNGVRPSNLLKAEMGLSCAGLTSSSRHKSINVEKMLDWWSKAVVVSDDVKVSAPSHY